MKIRVKKYINEEDNMLTTSGTTDLNNTAAPSNDAQDSNQSGATDEAPKETEAAKTVELILGQEVMSAIDEEIEVDVARNNILVNIKLPGEMIGEIPFPEAPSNMLTLMQDMGNAKKRKNLRGMIPDPTNTVINTADYAHVAFADVAFNLNLVPDNTDDNPWAHVKVENAVAEEPTENAEQPATDTSTAEAPVADTSTATSESLYYGNEQVLNEAIFDHILTFFGKHHDDDIAATKKDRNPGKSTSGITNADAAIDRYISSLVTNIRGLLKVVGVKNGADDVVKYIFSLENKKIDEIADYVNDNAEAFAGQRSSKGSADKALSKREKEQKIKKQITDEIASRTSQLKTMGGYKEHLKELDDLLKIRQLVIKLRGKLLKQWCKANGEEFGCSIEDFNSIMRESIDYDYSNRLFEADDDDERSSDDLSMNFEQIYTTLKSDLNSRFTALLQGIDPEGTADYTAAKAQMEALKARADESIKNRIEIICKTGLNLGGEQQGIGQKIKAWLSKHPLRAEKLKDTWAGHSLDLNDRMKQRLDAISNIDSNGGLSFCYKILSETVPELLARMITYKTIITLLKSKNVYADPNRIQVNETAKATAKHEQAQEYLNNILNMFYINGPLFTEDGSEFMKYENNSYAIVNNKVDLTLFVYNMFCSTLRTLSIESITSMAETLNNSATDTDTFAQEVCKAIASTNPRLISDGLEINLFNGDHVKDALEKVNSLVELYSNDEISDNRLMCAAAYANKKNKGIADKEETGEDESDENKTPEVTKAEKLEFADIASKFDDLEEVEGQERILEFAAALKIKLPTSYSELCEKVATTADNIINIYEEFDENDEALEAIQDVMDIIDLFNNLTDQAVTLDTYKEFADSIGIDKAQLDNLATPLTEISNKISDKVNSYNGDFNSTIKTVDSGNGWQSLKDLLNTTDAEELVFNSRFNADEFIKLLKDTLSSIFTSSIEEAKQESEKYNITPIFDEVSSFYVGLTQVIIPSIDDAVNNNTISDEDNKAVKEIFDAALPENYKAIVDIITTADTTKENAQEKLNEVDKDLLSQFIANYKDNESDFKKNILRIKNAMADDSELNSGSELQNQQ